MPPEDEGEGRLDRNMRFALIQLTAVKKAPNRKYLDLGQLGMHSAPQLNAPPTLASVQPPFLRDDAR